MATKYVVTGDQYRTIDRRMRDIKRQLDQQEGSSLDPELVADALQHIIEGSLPEKDWIETILAREHKAHQDFFGQKFYLVSFRDTLAKYGFEVINQWQRLGLEPHFLPLAVMSQDTNFDGWEVMPEGWYYQRVAEGKVLRRRADGNLLPDKEAFKLEGITVLVDSRLKPQYRDGKQMFQKDNLLGPIIARLRQDGKIAKYKYGPQSSRFGVSADEWEKHIKPALAEFLAGNIEASQVRLERTIEANVIPQLYPHMPRQKDGQTNTWVWYEEYFEDESGRLNGGGSGYGGLAHVNYSLAASHWGLRAVRPLVVLGV